MFEISFIVEGKPQGKGRPRFTRDGHCFTPASTTRYEGLVRTAATHAMNHRLPFESDFSVDILAHFEPPKSMPKGMRGELISREFFVSKKPDLDNICKAILDACNGTVWLDDKQVVKLTAEKRYSARDYVEVRIVAQ